jgi:hypothetical protein
MKRASRLALALILVLAAAGVPAHAQDDDGYEDDGGYETAYPAPTDDVPDPDELSPYGSWVDDPEYGRVWHPSVGIGWAPYVDGYWTWTPWGWTWVSSEPWAWTFHYGRWVLTPFGWEWVPGSVWGPAWVDWFSGDGFVGWAPLAPFGGVTVIERFVFVHDRDFCSRDLARRVVDHHLVPAHVIRRWQHRDTPHERPPGLHHITRVSDRPVERFDQRPPGTVAPRFVQGRPQLVRPAAPAPHLGGEAWQQGSPARLGRAWPPAAVPAPASPPVVGRGPVPTQTGVPSAGSPARLPHGSTAPRGAAPPMRGPGGGSRVPAGGTHGGGAAHQGGHHGGAQGHGGAAGAGR